MAAHLDRPQGFGVASRGLRRHLRQDPLRLIALGMGVVTVGFVVYTVVTQHRLGWNGGCGDDGLQYCLMALGQVAKRPWSRRVLMPFLVRVLPRGGKNLPGS